MSRMKQSWRRDRRRRCALSACLCRVPRVMMPTASAFFLWKDRFSERTAPPFYTRDEWSVDTMAAMLTVPRSIPAIWGRSVRRGYPAFSSTRTSMYFP